MAAISPRWRRRHLSIHSRLSLLLTAVAASFCLLLAAFWLQGTRAAIHEEMEAASRVAEQWLQRLAGETQALPAAVITERLLAQLKPLGRIRANDLSLLAPDGQTLYQSPPPTYKAGRSVPLWFAHLLSPPLTVKALPVGKFTLLLAPDASRAVLDAWDDLQQMALSAIGLLLLLCATTRWALNRALQPLHQLSQALDLAADGRFDTRLPLSAPPELSRLALAFNGMADRLTAAVNHNVQLETERELATRMQAALEEERRLIARELHDELAQGITAVRALAGAIAQRSTDQPALFQPAQSIVAVTSDLQDGVRTVLQRLRLPASADLASTLSDLLKRWQGQQPATRVRSLFSLGAVPVADVLFQTLIRTVQEALTNVARHAAASEVEVTLCRRAGWLQLSVRDNGRGLSRQPSPFAGCGFGVRGMEERIVQLGGVLELSNAPQGGLHLQACLPERLFVDPLECLK